MLAMAIHDEFNATFFPSFPNAKCRDLNGDDFFPDSKQELEERLPAIKQICDSCIHQVDCYSFAVIHQVEGIWAGTTYEERKLRFTEQEIRGKKITDVLEKLSNGFTVEEIAKMQGVKISSVQRLLFRAKQKGVIK
jgi:ribosomal protein L20A (L18A)